MKHLSPAQDQKIFRNTAVRTRVLNVFKFIPRGGIRL